MAQTKENARVSGEKTDAGERDGKKPVGSTSIAEEKLSTAAPVHHSGAEGTAERIEGFQPVGALLTAWTRAIEARADTGGLSPHGVGTVPQESKT
jgi:hypothetical protein